MVQISVRLFVCPSDCLSVSNAKNPTSHQPILNLSTVLESLGNMPGYKGICKEIWMEIKKLCYSLCLLLWSNFSHKYFDENWTVKKIELEIFEKDWENLEQLDNILTLERTYWKIWPDTLKNGQNIQRWLQAGGVTLILHFKALGPYFQVWRSQSQDIFIVLCFYSFLL